MSDNPSPHDAAILVLRERANAIELDINERALAIDRQRERLDEVQELIAVLSKKARPRKPRVIATGEPLGDQQYNRLEGTGAQGVPTDVISTQYPAKSVFASPPAPDAA